jgi:hypothetical protein
MPASDMDDDTLASGMMETMVATYGYPVLRLVAAFAVVWFSGSAPS